MSQRRRTSTRTLIALSVLVGLLAGDAFAAPPDLSGKWALWRSNYVLDKVPIVGKVTTRLQVIALLDAKQKGRTLTTQQDVCRMRMKNNIDIVTAKFLDGLPKGLSGTRRTLKIVGNGPVYRIQMPPHIFLWGAKLQKPDTEPLPTTPSDARVVDLDQDGKPGLTIRVGGIVMGELFVVQRDWTTWDGQLVSPNRIEGTVNWRFERVVIDRSSPILPKEQNARADPNPKRHRFIMVRVPKRTTCKKLLKSVKALFSK